MLGGKQAPTPRASDLLLAEVAAKRLQLLRELLPAARSIGYLRNPTNPVFAASETSEVQAAARALGMELTLMNVSSVDQIEAAFENLQEPRPVEATNGHAAALPARPINSRRLIR